MPTLEFRLTLAAPLDAAWAFHQDVGRALPLLSPPASDVRVISADLPARLGQRVVIAPRVLPGVRVRWVARIEVFEPPPPAEPPLPGPPRCGQPPRATRFVDVQESGPFAAWRHEHVFGEAGPAATRLTDRVTYRVRFGPLGRLADALFVRRQVEAMFRFRHAATRRAL
jgi:ligand-binding SRPBCC domain-containing protein